MDSLLEKTDTFVSQLFENKLPENCIYHNYTHTKRVFKSTKEIIEHSAVSNEDTTVLLLAVLLHDTGYTESIDNHEKHSVRIAESYLKDQKIPDATIQKITDLILATKMAH